MKEIINCDHCKQNPGSKIKNRHLWDGFLDGDTNERVCMNCKEIHYQKKFAKPRFRNLYSEFPVSIHPRIVESTSY